MTLEADQAVQEARFAGACQDQHAGRPAPSLGWPGERKSIVQQAVERKSIKVTGLGAGVPRGLGPRAWGLGRALGPGLPNAFGPGYVEFTEPLKKSPGRRQAKGWETAETAAAEVGAWREAGTGLPPQPPPPQPPPFLSCKAFHPFRY